MSSLSNMKSKQKQTVLIKAREDGRRFLTEHITSKDVCKLARICQRLSKYPRFYFHGPEFVSRPEFLHEAVQSLHQGLYAKGQTFHLAYTFGECLNGLGKFRIAVEWMKRAFFLSKHEMCSVKNRRPSSLALISTVCFCLLFILLNDDMSKYTSILVEYASKRIIGCLLIESERIWFQSR
jgi:hypothetical protein